MSGDVPARGGYGLGLDVWTDGDAASALAVETGIDASVAYHSIGGAFSPGARHLAAVVIEATTASVYVDGAPFEKVSASVPPGTQPTPLHLGCHNDDAGSGSKRFYRGLMRDVRIFTRALDAAAIARLYAAGPA